MTLLRLMAWLLPLALSFLPASSREEQEPQPMPSIQFDRQTHDFRTIPRDKVQHCVFTVTNTGTAPLLIHHVATSCGCTTTHYTKTAIPPGEKGKVEVDFNPATQRPGNFRKSITVYVNTIHAYTRLFVKGTITDEGH